MQIGCTSRKLDSLGDRLGQKVYTSTDHVAKQKKK